MLTITIILAILKLTGYLYIPWLWVFIPVLLEFVLAAILAMGE